VCVACAVDIDVGLGNELVWFGLCLQTVYSHLQHRGSCSVGVGISCLVVIDRGCV
jgi:hypothetical protein